MASGNEYKMREQVEAEELAKMKLHQQQYILTECDMHSNPLLLFRMLFFVAMQDKKGEVHLLSAFQVCVDWQYIIIVVGACLGVSLH